MDFRRVIKTAVKYIIEIVVIFVGITISFFFDEWKQGRELLHRKIAYTESLIYEIGLKKKELISDSPAALVWISRLDSINANRLSGKVTEKQLTWFFEVMTRRTTFFFNGSTPSFNTISTVWQELPDTIQLQIHSLFLQDFGYNELIYKDLRTTIIDFRTHFLIPFADMNFVDKGGGSNLNFKLFGEEIKKQAYGNLIAEIMIQEGSLYKIDKRAISKIESLRKNLTKFISDLKK